jgi:hypothetical protein
MEHSNVKALSDRILRQALEHNSAAYRQLNAAWVAGSVPRSRRESHQSIMEWAEEEIRMLTEERDLRSSGAVTAAPTERLAAE